MNMYVLAFLIGVVSGLRAFTGIAAISWAARLGWLHLEATPLALLGYAATPYILSFMALGELVSDKLPKTPSRLVPPQFGARVVIGGLCGAVLGLQTHMLLIGLILGVLGAVAGTLGGAKLRGLLAGVFGKDLPAALLEDVIAIALAFVVVSRYAA